MKAPLLLNCLQHPNFNHVVEDVCSGEIDDELMNMAKNSKLVHSEPQAEALYVILKLQAGELTLRF